MITRVEVEKLAQLAQDLESILGYVSELKEAPVADLPADQHPLINVLRADGEAHEPGLYTDELLAQMAKTTKGYLSVKPILNKD